MSFEKLAANCAALSTPCYRENGGIVVEPYGLRLWAQNPDEAWDYVLAYIGDE